MKDIKKEFNEEFAFEIRKVNPGRPLPFVAVMHRTPTELWRWIEQQLIEVCKEQKNICAKFFDGFPDSTEWSNTKTLRNSIKNAPLPKQLKEK